MLGHHAWDPHKSWSPTSFYKQKLTQMVIDLNVRAKTIKLLEDSVGVNYIWLKKHKIEKLINLDFIKF